MTIALKEANFRKGVYRCACGAVDAYKAFHGEDMPKSIGRCHACGAGVGQRGGGMMFVGLEPDAGREA